MFNYFFEPLEQFDVVFTNNLDYFLTYLFRDDSLNEYNDFWILYEFTWSVFFCFYSLINIFLISDLAFSILRIFMVLVILFFLMYGINSMGYIWPRPWQISIEFLYNFLTGTFRDQVGYRGQQFFPVLATSFLFVLFLNLFGMIPYEGAITSQLIFNLSLSFSLLVGLTLIGFWRQGSTFLNLFLPPEGVPKLLFPLIIFIEIISYVARGVSLGVRLFANIMAGHTLLFIFASFILSVNFILGFLIFVVIFLVTFLEFFIAALQAYVFYVLLTIYFRDSIEVSH